METSSNGSLIRLQDVVKTYETGAGGVTVLKDIDLRVNEGEFVGIDRPTSGEVVVAGQAVHKMSENQLARWRGKNVGVIFQFFQLLPTLTILENVMLPMDFCNVYKRRERKKKAMELLKMVGIADQAHKLPNALSGGQQQRAAIARALANDPPVIVADEPTGNLDTQTAAEMFALFDRLVDEGKTLLVVTHDRDLSEQMRRVIHLLDGRIERDHLNGHGRERAS
jgi:putative ABC transport system ATP-binding protein